MEALCARPADQQREAGCLSNRCRSHHTDLATTQKENLSTPLPPGSAGTYTEMTGAPSLFECLLAPPGNYAEGSGNDGFTPCPAGSFQDLPGQGSCKVGRA